MIIVFRNNAPQQQFVIFNVQSDFNTSKKKDIDSITVKSNVLLEWLTALYLGK